jgi:hypothetical protein
LAHAAGAAFAELPILAADIPAGLLDPIEWAELISIGKKIVLILQGANRSDLPLVLGSLRLPLLRQALGIQRMQIIVLLALESRPELVVNADLPLGPIVDDAILNFDGVKASAQISSCPCDELAGSNVPPMPREQFATELGDVLSKLPLLSASPSEAIYRRAYAALRGIVLDTKEARRLLFKYWCIPRLPRQIAHHVIESHRDEWLRDDLLLKLAATESDD